MNGTTELKTARLLLRRHLAADAEPLYQSFGRDPEMHRYTGWNPYATPEMAAAAVQNFIAGYADPRFYGWAIAKDG